MQKLPVSFYQSEDVTGLAKALLGKLLVTRVNGVRTSGVITETEAYEGAIDRASHAYGSKRTKRTETMFLPGGHAYVYLCYGIHHLFNVVTGPAETPHAVLVRAVEPCEGLDTMLRRRNMTEVRRNLTSGPGTVSQALAITRDLDTFSLQGDTIWLEENDASLSANEIVETPRIGVDYAGEHALWNYRFYVKVSKWVSKSRQPMGQGEKP